MKDVLILGSTGSIGEQAIDVIDRSPDLRIRALSADSSWERLIAQAQAAGVGTVALADEAAADSARNSGWDGRVLSGEEGIRELILRTEPDVVLNAIVGSAGLGPTIVALTEGIGLALANKESLVVGGELVMALSEASDARIAPVDSEHSALHQLISSEPPGVVDRLVLTASGGPFRGRDPSTFGEITVEEALAHPTWRMGPKITIDSATLMNKGLEVIEARWLFGIPGDRVDILVHPQSIVHSMVEFVDGTVLAQLGVTDMRLPIQYALSYPERWDAAIPGMDLTRAMRLDFEVPDRERFPCLDLAYRALAAGGSLPAVLNAANEEAVAAFLDGRIPFTAIP